MIQILSGQVKYKDRNDYLVEYTNIGDKQYYITNKLNNGNFVTTTVLKEAIHEEMNPTSFGVINSEGEIIIPCENKSINPSGEDYLIVESINLENETVKEMASLQNDPLNANKIVSLRAELKESLTNAMNGDNGNLEFANPCSEATVCDINGQNIVNNEKYSYIGRGDSGFYLRKVDSPTVVKYDYATNSLSNVGEQQEVNNTNEPLTPQVPIVEEAVEANSVPTEQEVNEAPADEVVQEQAVESTEVSVPETEEQQVSEVPAEETAVQSLDTEEQDPTEQEVNEAPAEEVVQEQVVEPTEEVSSDMVEQEVSEVPTEEVVTEEAVETTEEVPEETEQEVNEVQTEEVVAEEVDPEAVEEVVTDENTNLNIADVEVDQEQIENEINDVDSSKEVDNEDFKVNLDDYDISSKYNHYDSKVDSEDIKDAFDEAEEKTDELLPDVLRKAKKLVTQNRSYKNDIKNYKADLQDAEDINKALKGKIIEFKDTISELEDKNEHLKNVNSKMEQKIAEQQEIIERQKQENHDWKNKFQQSTERHDKWREEFKKILSYDSNDSYDYEDDYGSKRLVA